MKSLIWLRDRSPLQVWRGVVTSAWTRALDQPLPGSSSVDLVAGELVCLRQCAERLQPGEAAAPDCYGIDRGVPSGEWAWRSLVRRL
jgi:hypothetical protein